MKQLNEQTVQSCATATAELARRLAVAGTLCIYEGSEAIEPGINLIIGSAAAGEIATAYQNLVKISPQQDIYNVSQSDPPRLLPPASEIEFGQVLQEFARYLLTLHLSLHNLHHSYVRYEAANQALKANPEPTDSVHQDAQFFQVLQLQTIYQDLLLCACMHTEILADASRINFRWYRYQQNLPNSETFTSEEISKILTTIWQERKQEITNYNLDAFEVHGLSAALKLIEQQHVYERPQLLLNTSYHQSLQQLLLSYQETINTFYKQIFVG